ncbi:MAG: GNAT family N-acetyltransferase [Treponema sp.]|nr:GNAT family N-acetyltransferase [Treponema sp.]
MYLRYTEGGYLIILPQDDPHRIVDVILDTSYGEEFCVSPDFSPDFIARLMEAGFLVMSCEIPDVDGQGESIYILLPKLHLTRSVLFFENLHIKKSVRPYLKLYELRPNADFNRILDRCVEIHGTGWLTPPLLDAVRTIRERSTAEQHTLPPPDNAAHPVSFALYRNGNLVAGEFGVIVGRVYTSYSGYYDEDNAGTVQLVKTSRYLQERGFDFFDLGMSLDYKTGLGALDISPAEFVARFRQAQSPA